MFLEELFGLKGKVAVVTGGGRGIGQTIAVALAKAGADIVILSRTGADETVRQIEEEGGRACSIIADVTKEDEIDKALATIIERFGRIDILFNNAGICKHQTMFEATPADFREVVEINLTGEYLMAVAVSKLMIEKKIEGSIINMASISGTIVNKPQCQASYNASKAAVMHMTKSLAVELAPYNIRVNSLSPGYIATPMSIDTPQELKDAWMPLIPMGRFAPPEELITAVLYLTSSASGYTTGSDIIVDGAYTCI